MTFLTRHLSIHGRVQGVGFRWALSAEAKALGLRGWVRNRNDGSVEALVLGPPEAVEALTAWAHHGPSTAIVARVVSRDEPTSEDHESLTGFRQVPTF
ncbi:Acylphosphatase [Candidatus Propionivibrio aalborgensis]|jgi:acylphosphatase|uniref:Acylphosphatase n=1 Tax=Candidatus Propionivibrio aalborgensis TaxID=1860101 RepID=A0A1A8XFT6_9RHOO|nr:acylphosphatase [Candidatus Propionivibrio aalborgensis]MBK7324779.1 acylphosphatase [Propionivibrio sp.]MBK7562900.1 acylphosphatase [Propionivibrio sp.]MBK7565565.1 acylphosphatase [Propionivibrio sp.]MBK9028990.1 acylphosphatase [Propionivibrio sp.]SBT03217.1 Acylphosphatase [Candidatus Propionivibrio aalborgensis]